MAKYPALGSILIQPTTQPVRENFDAELKRRKRKMRRYPRLLSLHLRPCRPSNAPRLREVGLLVARLRQVVAQEHCLQYESLIRIGTLLTNVSAISACSLPPETTQIGKFKFVRAVSELKEMGRSFQDLAMDYIHTSTESLLTTFNPRTECASGLIS